MRKGNTSKTPEVAAAGFAGIVLFMRLKPMADRASGTSVKTDGNRGSAFMLFFR